MSNSKTHEEFLHEVRSSLMIIIGFASLMQADNGMSEEHKHFAQEIEAAGYRIQRAVEAEKSG